MTVEPRTDDDELLHCIVEIPKGSRNKYEWDERLGAIKLDRFLFSSLVYPTDYGYIPKTLADDGDALDVMVIVSEATFPGCVILVKPIALFRMRDEEGEGHAQARVRPRPPDGRAGQAPRAEAKHLPGAEARGARPARLPLDRDEGRSRRARLRCG